MSTHETGGRPADQPAKSDQPDRTETPGSRNTSSPAEDPSNRESRGDRPCSIVDHAEYDRIVSQWEAEDASNRESRGPGVHLGPNIRSSNMPVQQMPGTGKSVDGLQKEARQSATEAHEQAAKWEKELKVVLKK
jgi:hypothetical protein